MGRNEFYSSICFRFGATVLACTFATESTQEIGIHVFADRGASAPLSRPVRELPSGEHPNPGSVSSPDAAQHPPDGELLSARSDFPAPGLHSPRINLWEAWP
jgi:hypothetical protein